MTFLSSNSKKLQQFIHNSNLLTTMWVESISTVNVVSCINLKHYEVSVLQSSEFVTDHS